MIFNNNHDMEAKLYETLLHKDYMIPQMKLIFKISMSNTFFIVLLLN